MVGVIAGRWGLRSVISHCPQICSLLKLGFPATQRFPVTQVGYDANHTDCHRTGDNLLLNAQYYKYRQLNLLIKRKKSAVLLLICCSPAIRFLQV